MTSNEVVAFAKLLGDNNFVYYMTTDNVTLGRHAGSADIVLGEHKNISRCHARIQFNRPKQAFELSCMSKNGVFVDGEFVGPSNPPAQLRSRTLIQIGPRLIYFLLPKNVATSTSASEDDEGSELSKNGPQGIRITQMTSTAGKKWSRTSREKVRCALMRYGYGRWDVLSEALDDRDYTLANLQIYTSQLVQQLVENCDDSALKTGLIEILNSSPIELCSPDVPEPSLSGWSSLQKNVKKWSTRLILLYELKACIELFGESRLLDGIGSIKGRSLGPHWDTQEDLDLCIGIYRHGFGEFNAILNDESLCFKGKWAARLDAPKGDLDDDEDAVSQTIPETTQPTLPTHENATQQSESDQQSSLPEWPQHLALIGRLKRILELLKVKRGKHSSQKGGKKRREVPELNNEDAKRLKTVPKKASVKKIGAKTENTLGWTRKDQAAFQRGIIAQGRPDLWQLLRTTQPMLSSKTDNDLDQYYQKFLEAVDRIVVNRESPDDGYSDSSPITDEALLFSFGVAVKIRERIDLFQSLRALVEQHKETLCENSPPLEPPFNEWAPHWTPVMDYALLQAVVKYGIASWNLVWADADLPFASSGLSIPSESKILVKRAQQLISRHGLEFDVSSQKSRYVPRNPNQRGEIASQPTFGPDGSPNMPIQVTSSLRILNLGTVPPGRDFRDGKHVFPVGFQSERDYPSLSDPSRRCKYLCEVLQEDGRVRFKVTCADLPDEPIIADKPTHVWKQIETRLDTRRSTTRKRSTINGVEKFGLNHPLVMSLLMEDPSAAARSGKVENEKSASQPAVVQPITPFQPDTSVQSSAFSAPAPVSDYEDAPMDVESESSGEEGDEDEEADDENDNEGGDSSDIDLEGSDDEPGQPLSEI